MNTVIKKLTIGIFGILFCIPLFADDIGRGGYAGSFLRMGLGAKAMSMGGGSAALAAGGTAAYDNPAGLVFLNERWLTASMNSMALDRTIYSVEYAQSISGRSVSGKRQLVRGGFSLGWISSTVDNIDGRDFDGNHTEMYSDAEHCFHFSFALNPDPRIAFGFTGKLLYNRIPAITDKGEAMSSTGFGFDIGGMIKPVPSLTFGLVLRDLRSKYTWDSQKLYERGTQTIDRFPKIIRAGASWRGWKDRLVISCDVEKIEYSPRTISGGIEAVPVPDLFLRSGVRHNELTFGAGYRFQRWGKTFVLDYAYIPDPVAPRDMHVLGWSFVF